MVTYLTILVCGLLFAAGGLVRDGTPSLGTTHGARALGAFLCGLGALVATGNFIVMGIAFLGILAGFYTDQKHGEGQQARDIEDAAWLAVSGFTSLVPLCVLAVVLLSPWCALVALAALTKPAIWFACWRVFKADTVSFSQPTRVAALVFGFVVGCAFAGSLVL